MLLPFFVIIMEIKYKYVKKGFSLFVKEQRESLLFFMAV
ncbi:hypothetical protein BB14905_07139 [Bacillus sp. B14905]|nr:hypothetical protein BB14905_07139 [Bacillus sp. B14905]